MILEYEGVRLEEGASLAVEDVIFDPIPHLHIRLNEFRRIKNLQSDRLIPIHPELIRLGFLKYVIRIRELGYRMVFPDLHARAPAGTMGCRLYDEYRRILSCSCADLCLSPDFDLHSHRHAFDDRLKDAGVSLEHREDLMGHEGRSETSARYSNALKLVPALTDLEKLPVVTGHLEPHEITLLPFIEADAPRKKRRMQ